MFYKWLHPIDPDNITSYIAKTVMLWTCEKYPPDDTMWNEDLNSTVNVLRNLFKALHNALKESFLPYYFIPEINIIEHIPEHPIAEVLSKTLILFRTSEILFLKKQKKVMEK